MIGILTDYPDNLRDTGIFPSESFIGIEVGKTYQARYSDYDMRFSFTYGSPYQAAASTQMLVDDGCTIIIYLSHAISDRDGLPINVTSYVSSKYEIFSVPKNPVFIGFLSREVEKSKLSDSLESYPVNDISIGVVTVANTTRTPIMLLLDKVKDKIDTNYSHLGYLLSTKLEMMLKADYDETMEDKARQLFNPVTKIEQSFFLNSRKADNT